MTLLLDTHAVLWWAHDDRRLGGAAREAIVRADVVLLSSICVWEIEIKRALGRLQADPRLREKALAGGFTGLAFTPEHAEVAGRLPRLHDDPFDRALVAQARVEDVVLVTGDAVVPTYEVRTLDARA